MPIHANIHSNFSDYKSYNQFAAIPNKLNIVKLSQYKASKLKVAKNITLLTDVATVSKYSNLAKFEAAELIQKSYRSYQQKKSNAEINKVGIKSLTNAKAGRSYFYNSEGDFVARTPTKFQLAGEGNFKQLVRKDNQFVQLHIYNDMLDVDKTQYNQLMMNELKHHPSICPSIYVNDSTMIARNGGMEVAKLIEKGNKISLIHFKSLLTDLHSLHLKKIFLHDIKPNNLTYNGTNVRHIDVENLVAPDYNDGENGIVCTDEYTTIHLTNAILNGDTLADQNHDNYSTLLSIIEATSGNFFKNAPTENPKRTFGLQGDDLIRARGWILDHIKPEFQARVEALLKLPGCNHDSTPLVEMINWK
ncbi:hypothetical protein CKQ84_18810 [Shewanella sp. WE21]|jgi:hypothetical protein|uniref:hypothetical protein n=1 Tax=Shewanella sp. WE21 TaxID=2029986 RepID=UPI000CF613C0|nr:hypothetical protein [Shewanella sp. WE21]AVI67731.1 hypothetical protein CKQ84_18810 [Shewanella sp. WE21]